MNTNISISVLIVVFNRKELLKRAIDSFIIQDYPYKELIVIDGGSTDGTVDILIENERHITYWKSEPDRGIYHAFNKALDRATGNWIYFLGSDDYLWNDSVLSNFVQNVCGYQNIPLVVYGKVVLVSKNGDELEQLNKSWQETKPLFLEGCYICHQGVFHSRKLFDIHGIFDESFRISGVYELLLRELKDNDALFLPDLTVAAMQTGGLSTSSRNSLEIFSEYERARRKNNVKKTLSLRLFLGYSKNYAKYALLKIFSDRQIKYIADIYRILTLRKPIWFKID
jgi:glycosyltransferase involved in cell wall biosynthesis